MNNTAGVVLSGGQSSRMGTDKSLLTLAGKSLLSQAKETLLQADIDQVYVSGALGIIDHFQNKGPLSGIYSSLEYLKDFEYVLFTAVDMPLLTKEVYLNLIDQANLSTIVYFDQWYLPFIIHNHVNVREIIVQHLNHNKLSLRHTFKFLKAQSIPCQYKPELFSNVNTPSDWQNVKSLDYFNNLSLK